MPVKSRAACVGAVQNGAAAVLVTVQDGRCLDRRCIELIPPTLPTHPHHHEGSWALGRYLDTPGARRLTLEEALALVQEVQSAAAQGAHRALDLLAARVEVRIDSISLRCCPALPATTEARIRDARAQTFADSVMYRLALSSAAQARDWSVHWYEPDLVFRDAAAVLEVTDIRAALKALGRPLGPPWRVPHRLAAAAAIAASVATLGA